MCIALTFTTPNGQGEFSFFDLFFSSKNKQISMRRKQERRGGSYPSTPLLLVNTKPSSSKLTSEANQLHGCRASILWRFRVYS
jgi:hypothetical protein